MDLGKYILSLLNEQGRSQTWLADKLNINVKTFSGKLKRNSITGEEILQIGYWLNINLDELKKECINYGKK
jgi:hypothetical protein